MTFTARQAVTLAVEDAGEVPAVVEAADEEVITLILALRADEFAASRLDQRPATVECTTARGVVRVAGRVETAGRAGVLRVRRERADVVQRREAVRVAAALPVRLVLPYTGRTATTTTLDLSRTGVRIVQPFILALGVPLDLAIDLDPDSDSDSDSGPIELGGRVLRDDGQDGKGVVIERISPADEERLAGFIADRQRLLVRQTRRP